MEIAGKKVVDGNKPIKLHITADDVKKGANKNPSGCAAALAALREIPEVKAARVHVGRTYLQIKDKWVRYQTPKSLRTEIVAFDRGGKFEPGEYHLAPLPLSYRNKGKMQGTSTNQYIPRHGRKKPKIARIQHRYVTGIRAHGANR
jgi:hypothetical protein